MPSIISGDKQSRFHAGSRGDSTGRTYPTMSGKGLSRVGKAPPNRRIPFQHHLRQHRTTGGARM